MAAARPAAAVAVDAVAARVAVAVVADVHRHRARVVAMRRTAHVMVVRRVKPRRKGSALVVVAAAGVQAVPAVVGPPVAAVVAVAATQAHGLLRPSVKQASKQATKKPG